MTNDQKLVFLIHAAFELIDAEEKADTAGMLFKQEAKKKRQALKIWLINNKVVSAAAPNLRKQKQLTRVSHNAWLAK